MTSDLSMEKIDTHTYQLDCINRQMNRTSQSMQNSSSLLVGGIKDDGGDNISHGIHLHSNSYNNYQNNQGQPCSASIFGSNDNMSTPLGAAQAPRRSSIGHKNFNSLNMHDLVIENQALRDQLAEVTTDRNRLLCEVSNLRLELDMCELKRLPEGSFPQKPVECRGSSQYGVGEVSGSNTSSSESGGGYVYLQQHFIPSTASTNQMNFHSGNPHSMLYQHQTQPFAAFHQQPVSISLHGGGVHYTHQLHNQNHGHHKSGHQQHFFQHGGAIVTASSGVGCTGTTNAGTQQQNVNIKCSMRSGNDVLKRSRTQSAYELSQDLLEKQIELLERKYGGVRARNAAITIQRAFRHYMMVKKFASITAMAKAEKRLSRRTMVVNSGGSVDEMSAYGSATESNETDLCVPNTIMNQQQAARVTIMPGPPGAHQAMSSGSRTPPTRSLSMRERRHVDSGTIPRSQSGASNAIATNCTTLSNHPHVNLLHASEPHYYAIHNLSGCYHSTHNDISFTGSATSSNLDSQLNVSWVNSTGCSPHTPYYSAAQIYMRPRGSSSSSQDRKKIPPEVPKRTSSINVQNIQHQGQQMLIMRQTPPPPALTRGDGLCKTSDNGSLISVQSSGSDSSATSMERNTISDMGSDRSNSPQTWKRDINLNNTLQFSQNTDSAFAHSHHTSAVIVGSAAAVEDHAASSHTSAAQYEHHEQTEHQQIMGVATQTNNYRVSETIRKRQYRVGLNLFNKKPEKGITYLIRRGFLENTPQGVARFLITRKGLSRQMIGEYLGNLQNPFNMAVLNCFAAELDLSGMQVDVALRKFQAYFRMPGEAQKIERLMEIFSQRYCQCNQDIVGRLRTTDTIFVLAFAIIMLNTDLHTPNLKPERRMRLEDFVKNLRGIDDCHDIDKDMLGGIYERVKANEFKPGSDHVTQVMKVQATIVGKKPNLALPHRRLVCYCRLYEIPDVNKKERPGVHQREVFLFNDLLVITKIFSKKKSSVTYTFRNSFPLCGMVVTLLDVANYPFCIQLSQKVDGKILVTFNARNEHDRCKFAEDLKESVCEMDEMESLRIEAELERQKSARTRATGNSENRDSGVADVEVCPCPYQTHVSNESVQGLAEPNQQLKRSALSNSLLDIHEQFGADKPQRRGSVGSLDSGMSISFQSTTASNISRDNAAIIADASNAAKFKTRISSASSNVSGMYATSNIQGHGQLNCVQQNLQATMQNQQQVQLQLQNQRKQSQSSLGGRIPGRDRKVSRSEDNRSTEV